MEGYKLSRESIKKIALVGLLTALTVVLSFIKIPIFGVSITLVLPVVIIGGALYGPYVGAWLTVIPNIIAFTEAGLFLAYSPFGGVVTMLLKGLVAGFVSAIVYKMLSQKNQVGAIACSAVVAPALNSGIFVLGCLLFIWKELVSLAGENGVGIGMLLFGLAGFNFIVELIINAILCPTILRIIQLAAKKKLV